MSYKESKALSRQGDKKGLIRFPKDMLTYKGERWGIKYTKSFSLLESRERDMVKGIPVNGGDLIPKSLEVKIEEIKLSHSWCTSRSVYSMIHYKMELLKPFFMSLADTL